MMQSGFNAHVTNAEWRWVIWVSLGLLLLAFAPYGLVMMNSSADWQFMGILHISQDGATYLSKMMLGVQGSWLVHFQHTPETHNSAFIQVLYPLLGQFAALINAPVLLVFHVARVLASFFMYLAIYQLAAAIWMLIRSRRIFFVLAALGSGFGWIYALLTGGSANSPDLLMPEAFPFYSSLVNVHFPLTIACIALLVAIIINIFRPGADIEPRINNSGLVTVLYSLALGLLYPQAIVPMGIALVLFVALRWWGVRRIVLRELNWLLVILLPVLPLAVYYGAIVVYNPAMNAWMQQNVTTAPPPLLILVGFGLPLLVGLPEIYRSLRHFDAHDDRFMVLWLLVILIAMYFPSTIQRRFAVGMILPVAYFATRAVEGFWFQGLSRRRWRYRIVVFLVPLIALTHLFVLFVPALPVLVNFRGDSQGLFLDSDYVPALNWLRDNSRTEDVVLAGEYVSRWLPGWTGARVVYGHPYETLDAAVKLQQVDDWYASGNGDCSTLLDDYNVRYVVFGPEEARLGEAPCLAELEQVERNGDVTVYAP